MPQLTNLNVEWVSLVDRAAVRDPSNPTEPQRFLVWKSESGANPDPEGGSMETPEELRAALAKAEKKLAKAEAKLAKKAAKKQPDTDADNDNDAVAKSDLPDAVKAALAKAEEDRVTLAKRAEKAEKIAKEERDLRVRGEFIAKAEAEFPHLGNPTELGPELMRMRDALSKEDYDAHLQRLTAANEQIAKGALFAELGRGGDGRHSSDGDDLVRKADEIRKANPTLSQWQAMEQARLADRNAQAAYLASVR